MCRLSGFKQYEPCRHEYNYQTHHKSVPIKHRSANLKAKRLKTRMSITNTSVVTSESVGLTNFLK
jgi:hypothetical protein